VVVAAVIKPHLIHLSYNGNTDEIFLKLLASQPKLFNNNFQLLREITRLDEESFNHYWRVFISSLSSEESTEAMRLILRLKDSTCYSGEISALVNELRNQTPLYEKSGTLTDWVNLKDNFEEVISSLVKIKGDSLFNLDSFRLVKRQKATDIFNLRFTNGVADPKDVEWWEDFNQLCIDMKFLNKLKTEWDKLSDEERQRIKILFVGEGKDQKTLEEFMEEDFSAICLELQETLIELCSGSPLTKEYLLGHHWCYSEYTRLLEKNHITLKNELEFINALDEFLDSSMKLTSGTLAERSKVRNDMFNKLVTKENMIRWIKNGYKFIIKGIEEE
jgi:hypothetical protein